MFPILLKFLKRRKTKIMKINNNIYKEKKTKGAKEGVE